MFGRFKIASVIVVLIFLASAPVVYACVGSRPLGMGGAFIAVADDVNSIYWNPAGLGRIRGKVAFHDELSELTYTRLMNRRDVQRYDDYFAAAYPNVGIKVIHERWKRTEDVEHGGDTFSAEVTREHTWVTLGAGYQIAPEVPFYFGTNLRYRYREIKEKSEQKTRSSSGGSFELDGGLLWEITSEISLGLLSQNLIRAGKGWWNTDSHNFRTGIAWDLGKQFSDIFAEQKMPDITVALDVYDAFNNFHRRSFTAGVEAGVLDIDAHKLNLRTGSYMLDRSSRAITGGAGYEHEAGFKLDFVVMHWDAVGRQNHWVTVGWKF